MATVSQKTRTFRDISFLFSRHPSTNDVNSLTDEQSIRQSLKNLILTKNYEKLFHPEIGCQVNSLLFDNFDPSTSDLMSTIIELTIRRYEPRVRVISVKVAEAVDRNEVDVTLDYAIVNSTETFTFSTTLTRAR